MNRPLRVFLCHSSNDKPAVRELYKKLTASGIDAWLDEKKLLPGQKWRIEIPKAVREADAVIVCLSENSVTKEGYVQKEILFALDIAQEKPENTIYLIPVKIEECNIPDRLSDWQWVGLFETQGLDFLFKSLKLRADSLNLMFEIPNSTDWTFNQITKVPTQDSKDFLFEQAKTDNPDLGCFVSIPSAHDVLYSFCISKYPITNAQYGRFLASHDFVNPIYWTGFSKYDENCKLMGDWGDAGFEWLKTELKKSKSQILIPHLWDDKKFGSSNLDNPVVGISYYEASAYCKWLFYNWETLSESKVNSNLVPKEIRLPLETEWEIAAGGCEPKNRYPWDEKGIVTTSIKEILYRANVEESVVEQTTSVTAYPLGRSPYGVIDMAGNVSEFQANFSNKKHLNIATRGGSWNDAAKFSRVANRYSSSPGYGWYYDIGFRAVFMPLQQ
jgi:formylglycine-generating enzyme required for sulfatase activity